jgi:methyl-accepting chemotaxis protein
VVVLATQIADKMTDATNNRPAPAAATVGDFSGKRKSIRQHLLWCFLIIALVSLGVGAILLVGPAGGSAGHSHHLSDTSGAAGKTAPWRVAAGILLIIAAAGGVFYRLYRIIVGPLEEAAASAGRIAEGNLSETISACTWDEIARIGDGVNSLAVNFQEALILVWNQTESAIAQIQRTTGRLMQNKADNARDAAEETAGDLNAIRQDLETMQMMIRSFDLYDVTISEGDVLTAKDKVETLN